jgi:mycoredoxin
MSHASAALTMYTTPWCGYCIRLKRQMTAAGIVFDEVDIEEEPTAADLVEAVNDGDQTVPTIVFGDGSALTNPSIAQITDRLAATGS